MFNKNIEKRLASLEDYLGLVYIPENGGWVSGEHIPSSNHSIAKKLEKLLEETNK